VFPISTYLIWIHQIVLGIVGAFVPSILASVIVLKYADLKKYASSPLGRYVRRYMTRSMEAVRFAGLLVSWLGAWYNLLWVIGVGILIVVLAWARGKIVP
jgi:cell division protein FtsX